MNRFACHEDVLGPTSGLSMVYRQRQKMPAPQRQALRERAADMRTRLDEP